MPMSVIINTNGSFTIGCHSSSTTSSLAAGSTAAQIITAYQSIATFAECQGDLQTLLDALFDLNFDLRAFIRAGTSTTVTGTNIGTFLATICNNYRSLRASITAATTLTQLNAININSGWPSNP